MCVRTAVLASGRGSNFAALCEAQRRGELDPAKIVVLLCNKPGALVLERAREAGVESLLLPHKNFSSREEFDAAVVRELKKREIELVVLAGFMRVLTPAFIEAFPARILNLHPALLPSFPGTDGIGEALRYGVKVTGVTVHFVDTGVDTGPIILQEPVTIHDNDTEEALAARIHAIEHELLPRAVRLAASGRTRIMGRRVLIQETFTPPPLEIR